MFESWWQNSRWPPYLAMGRSHPPWTVHGIKLLVDRARSDFFLQPTWWVNFRLLGPERRRKVFHDGDDVGAGCSNRWGVINKSMKSISLYFILLIFELRVSSHSPTSQLSLQVPRLPSCISLSLFLPALPWRSLLRFPKPVNQSVLWERQYAAMVLQRHSTSLLIAAFDVRLDKLYPSFFAPSRDRWSSPLYAKGHVHRMFEFSSWFSQMNRSKQSTHLPKPGSSILLSCLRGKLRLSCHHAWGIDQEN